MLSQRGFRLLKQHKREFKMGRSEFVAILEAKGIPLFEPVIDFQVRFGGYRIPWNGMLGICFPAEIALEPSSPTHVIRDDVHYFECDLNLACEFTFIDQAGIPCIGAHRHPVAESIENLIEYIAYVREEAENKGWSCIQGYRLDTNRGRKFMAEIEPTLNQVSEVSDRYQQILRTDEILYLKRGISGNELYVSKEVAKDFGRRK